MIIVEALQHQWWVLRKHGFRYWLAWKLVCLATRLKDTTGYQVILTPGGGRIMVLSDAWDSGVITTQCVNWADHEETLILDKTGWPVLREFTDHEEALDYFHDADLPTNG